eukprot:TRINITY_DN4078_c0_g2_i1.p1 TRINITY_DN4078_c0_g2~~TRINITY_DN4078_c0_g2_i1.p1  ORF type:complete len:392 (+),score=67.35 TRINITY_DN4078_c0_g2_i1:241-1416(+)
MLERCLNTTDPELEETERRRVELQASDENAKYHLSKQPLSFQEFANDFLLPGEQVLNSGDLILHCDQVTLPHLGSQVQDCYLMLTNKRLLIVSTQHLNFCETIYHEPIQRQTHSVKKAFLKASLNEQITAKSAINVLADFNYFYSLPLVCLRDVQMDYLNVTSSEQSYHTVNYLCSGIIYLLTLIMFILAVTARDDFSIFGFVLFMCVSLLWTIIYVMPYCNYKARQFFSHVRPGFAKYCACCLPGFHRYWDKTRAQELYGMSEEVDIPDEIEQKFKIWDKLCLEERIVLVQELERLSKFTTLRSRRRVLRFLYSNLLDNRRPSYLYWLKAIVSEEMDPLVVAKFTAYSQNFISTFVGELRRGFDLEDGGERNRVSIAIDDDVMSLKSVAI